MYTSSVVGLIAATLSAVLFFASHFGVALMAYAVYANKRDRTLDS